MAKNKVPWIVGGCLVVLVALIALVVGGGKKKSKASTPPPTARAVVVPTSIQRTVVVAPCGAPTADTVTNAAAGKATPGATTLSLPVDRGVRTILVANCLPKTGAVNATGNLPSAAMVMATSEQQTEGQAGDVTSGSFSARSKAVLPDGSKERTVVVSPCAKKTTTGKTVVITPAKGHADVALAPSC
ncbi:MAG TPA: hypothetical protein VGF21_19755 [Thermoleophilaceae bacterium]